MWIPLSFPLNRVGFSKLGVVYFEDQGFLAFCNEYGPYWRRTVPY